MKKLLLSVIPLLLFSACSNRIEYNKNEENLFSYNQSDSEEIIQGKGLQIKKVSTGTVNGNPYKTYSYSISPVNASETEVTASVSFADNRNNGSSYLTVSIDNSAKTFTVVCLAAFNSVATVRLQAVSGSAYANITVNYKQKNLSFNYSTYTKTYSIYEIQNANVSVLPKDAIVGGFSASKSSTYTIGVQDPYFVCFGSDIDTPVYLSYDRISVTNIPNAGQGGSYALEFYEHIRSTSYGFPTMNLNATSQWGEGFYQILQSIINTKYTSSTKYHLNSILDSNDCFEFTFNLRGISYKYFDPGTSSYNSGVFGSDLNVVMPLRQSWGLPAA